jgi:hypothetical protein
MMRCPNPACRDGLVPRDAEDWLYRGYPQLCQTCGGCGMVATARLGNVGPGASGKLPSAAPLPGDAAAEVAKLCRICHPGKGKAECTGGCCC